MATEILNGALSKIGEYLVEATTHQVGYLFRFKGNVEGLKRDYESLRSAMARVQGEVERAKNNAEDIEEEVQKWLNDVSNVTVAVQNLNEEIEANKTCFSGLCPNLALRYRLSRKAEKMTSIMLKLIESSKFGRVSHRAPLPSVHELLPSQDFVAFESTKFTFDRIIEAMKDDEINMVGIYGMGGVGKTTMAKEVAKKVKELNIFKEVVFAVVSKTPNVRNIQGQIADLLGLKFDEESEVGRAGRLSLRITGQKILIILDDVWEKLDLTIIGVHFGDDQRGCKILLTTRRRQVCDNMGYQGKIAFDTLKGDEGLTLFKRYAGIGDELPTLNDLVEEVAGECKGLPLAIVTIGSALKGKDIDEWKEVLKRLKNSKFVDVDETDRDIYACLKLSYDYLKDVKTKLCFLLCSLFPEDYEMPLEELIRYAAGQDWYEDANTIDEARSQLRVMINRLKASCLLLEGGDEEHVKMHDIVRDVAVWIASKEKKFFSKAGLRLKKWPKDEGLEQYAAISLMGNELEVLPVRLACPNLEILLLGCKYRAMVEVSDQFFVETKALKVVYLGFGVMSVKSLQFLTNLRSLCLHNCELKDISSIGTVSKLEILSFRGSRFEELAKELGELGKLRQLDLQYCRWLKRIPANVIRRLSQLEELYIGRKSFSEWDVKGTGADTSNASLKELDSLPRLTMLSLWIEQDKCIPKDFTFPKLIRYQIVVSPHFYRGYNFPSFKRDSLGSIILEHFGSTSFNAFKEVCHTLQTLEVRFCNALTWLFTTSLARSLVHLEKLSVYRCGSMKHIIVAEEEQLEDNNILAGDGSDIVLPKLRELQLDELPNLMSLYPRNYCSPSKEKESLGRRNTRRGSTLQLRLLNLTRVEVRFCKTLTWLFTVSLARSLVHLEKLSVYYCGSMKHIIVTEEEQLEDNNILVGDGSDIVLPKLRELRLEGLPNLMSLYPRNYCSPSKEKESPGRRNTWRGSTLQLRLLNLTRVEVGFCKALTWLFTVSLARSLVHLKKLYVYDCGSMKYIIVAEEEQLEDNNILVGDGSNIVLPKLRELRLDGLPNLMSFCEGNYYSTWPSLQELSIDRCPSFTFTEASGKDSNFLKVNNIARLSHGLKNLKFLEIKECSTQVIFQLEGFGFDGGEGERLLSFPSLETLVLIRLPKLECIWKGPSHFSNLQNLSKLDVRDCPKLRRIFSTTLARNLSKLKFLSIRYCSALEQIIVQDDEEEEQHQQPAYFSNLSKIEVSGCHNLKSLFHVNIARNLQQLKILHIKYCEKLEQIFAGDDAVKECKEILLPGVQDDEEEEQHQQPACFSNLSKIEVSGCDNLKSLFHVNIARNLQQLKILHISDCEKLEQIFAGDDAVKECKEIVLPGVERLKLQVLPGLVHLCPVGRHLIFPSLTCLRVTSCPKIAARFSINQNGSMQVKSEARQLGEEATFAADIICRSTDEIRQLPPYMPE